MAEADDAHGRTDTAMRHLGDPGTAEIVAPGETDQAEEDRGTDEQAPGEEATGSGQDPQRSGGTGEDAGYVSVPAAARAAPLR